MEKTTQVGRRHMQQRTQDAQIADRRSGRHSGQSGWAGAAQQSLQDGFRLIVGVMG
jgi:hypothetical protein